MAAVDKRSALVDEALAGLKEKMHKQAVNLLRAEEMLHGIEADYRSGVLAPSKVMGSIRQMEGGLGL